MEKAFRVTQAELFTTPVPVETKTYKPISHQELAETTLEAIEKAGFKLGKQEYSAAKYGDVANARYTIQDIRDKEMQLEIGWQNSYDKTLSLKFAIGTRIFICDNGCVSGDLGSFKKIHKGDIQDFTPDAIIEAIKSSGETFVKIQRQREALKEIEVSKRLTAELIGRMYIEEEMLQSTQLSILKKELKKPTFDYGCPNSLWELYNFTTYAIKDNHPQTWMRNHILVHKFFTEAMRTKGATITASSTLAPIDAAQISILDVIGETEM